MSTLSLRPATADDVPTLFEFLRASAEEQGGLDELCIDEQSLAADGFGPAARFHALVAEVNGEPAGVALYYFNYSTWTSRNGLYLEDLYVKPEFRRAGVARKLMQRLAQIADEHSCRRFLWFVLRDNTPAIRFYESLGAAEMQGCMPMRITGSAQHKLAKGN